jgi:ferredoxin-nitrate reductase
MIVRKDRWGRLTSGGDPDYPVNRGLLCSKGRYLHQTAMDRNDRLLFPQMRWSRAHPMERVSWDTALDRAAAVFKTMIAKHGPESVAFYVSGQLLTEEYYIANKLMKGFIGCNIIDTNSRLCMASAASGYRLSLGDDACPIGYEDIEQCECFFVTGSNAAWCHPILFQRLEKRKSENPKIGIIVVDSRRTQTCSIADLHLQIQPGTDVTLYNAIARHLIESNLIDSEFIAAHTSGIDKLTKQPVSLCITFVARNRPDTQDLRRFKVGTIVDKISSLFVFSRHPWSGMRKMTKQLKRLYKPYFMRFYGLVGAEGLEPPSLASQDPKTCEMMLELHELRHILHFKSFC